MIREKHIYRYIYGPVSSWRLGRSLGIDPVYTGKGKICSFDCIYCQAGTTDILTSGRKVFVPTGDILNEIRALPRVNIDYITFSGKGEPALARNLGEIIQEVRKIRKEKIAVLTNASVMHRKDVRKDLAHADVVIAKLDAASEDLLGMVNRPAGDIKFESILYGLKEFRKMYTGKLALQIMFVKRNKKHAGEIARIARGIRPDEIHINTPLRPSGAKALSRKDLKEIVSMFDGMKVFSVYDAKRRAVRPISEKETLERRGKV